MNRHNFIFVTLLLIFSLGQSQNYEHPRGIPTEEDQLYKQMPQKAPLTRDFYVGAPSSYSLKKYAPTPKSQGSYGTCTGWAVAYAARTILEAQKNKWTSTSTITQNAFSPTFQYRAVMPDRSACDGAQTSYVVRSLKTIGAIPMKDFYVQDGKTLCPSNPMPPTNTSRASQNKIDEYTTLWAYDMTDNRAKVDRVKTSISEGNPVAISIICPGSFDKIGSSGLWQPTESPTADVDGRQHGRHALCVVGYDNNKYGGAFEIQNSWGTSWGNGGYCWVKYGDFQRFTFQAFELVQMGEPKPKAPLLAGSLRLFDMDDKINLPVELAQKSRNWNSVGPSGGGDYTYKVKARMQSGSKMRMYLKSEAPAYVYMFGTGVADRSVNTLFPVDGISPAMNYSGAEVALPSEDYYFEMDNTTGKNYIILVFSKEKLNTPVIKNRMTASSGTTAQRVKNVFGELLIDAKNIQFSNGEIKFSVAQSGSSKKAFAMIIEFEQGN